MGVSTDRSPVGEPLEFLKRVVASPAVDGCIIWPYGMSGDYGTVRFEGRKARASRVALILAKGPPPFANAYACHAPGICHNPACVNPGHLRWDTNKANQADRRIDGTNHANVGSDHGLSKLTDDQVRWVRSNGLSGVATAEELGVSTSAVSLIRRGKTWTHVD